MSQTEEIITDITDLIEYLGQLEGRLNSDPSEKYVKKYSPTIKRWKRQAKKMWLEIET